MSTKKSIPIHEDIIAQATVTIDNKTYEMPACLVYANGKEDKDTVIMVLKQKDNESNQVQIVLHKK